MKKNFKKFFHRTNNQFLRMPRPLLNQYFKVIKIVKSVYFLNEWKLIVGLQLNRTKAKSVLFFAVPKTGSTFVRNTIFDHIDKRTYIPINFEGAFDSNQRLKYLESEKHYGRMFRFNGFFYGAIRKSYNIPNLEKYRILVLVRDPRDVLTSLYFSTAFNHSIANPSLLEQREKALNQTIDEFVLERAPDYKKRYEDLINLKSKANHLDYKVLKYERMISDFETWLKELRAFLKLDMSDDQLKQKVKKTSFKIKENKNSFVRNIKAGDHVEKLNHETIKKLNFQFRSVLEELDYD